MILAAEYDELQSLLEQSEQSYRTFRPRPDQPDRFDQQTGFVSSETSGVAWLIGGNGAGTTECALHKLAQFVLNKQAPPRKDTPFWIIANTYEQVCKAAWKEKLIGHGHIPPSEVQWDAIRWYKENQDWPYEVPLKPWPGRPGKNWTLSFKSYKQGRAQMQAESIGGFCFIEQFPWVLLEEALRGCREYNFPGSKFCEFTPIDPTLSIEIEEMIENGHEPDNPSKVSGGKRYLPRTWEVYRANTECALEAGHVNREWFDEFFGMVSEEMLLTRLTGEFASYEGAIYTGFNPKVHLIGDVPHNGDLVMDFPSGAHHRRGIDWGFGTENAFVCLWGYRNGQGQWFIYDEYYSTDQTKTVLDHLNEIGERHPWPQDGFHGTTWADPSDPGSIRLAQSCGFSISQARNAVHEGIDYVRYLLQSIPGSQQRRLYIHKDNCPHLARQMRTYRWLRGSVTGVNPRDARPEPLKKDDHAVDAARYLLFSESQYNGLSPSVTTREADHTRHGINMEFGSRGYLLRGRR